MKKNLILLVVSLVLFLVILETVFRVFGARDQEKKFLFNLLASINDEGNSAVGGSENICFELDDVLFWRMRPNLDNCEWDPVFKAYITTNRYGLRGEDFPRSKPPGSFRILALGDSVPYGLRVEAEEAFPHILEKKLKPDPDFPGGVEVINSGIPGYSSYQGLLYLRERGLDFEPDLIIVCFGYNDSHLRQCSDRKTGQLKRKITRWDTRSSRLLHFLSQKSALVRNLNYFVYSRIVKRGYDFPRVSEDEYHANLQRIIDLARERGIEVIFLPPPFRGEVDLSTYADRMRYVAKRNEIPCVFDPRFTGAFDEQNTTLFADDAHPGAYGHAVLSELLYRTIKGMKWRKGKNL